MPVDPLLIPIITKFSRLPEPNSHIELTELRDGADALYEFENRYCEPTSPLPVEYDDEIQNGERKIPIRVYLPTATPNTLLPVHIYLHGGGWWLGGRESCVNRCREIAAGTNCIVVTVGYRLAPEHKFPAGLEDCYFVATQLAAGSLAIALPADFNAKNMRPAIHSIADTARISIGGDSAGANLSAAVVLKMKAAGYTPFIQLVLECPVLDARMNTESYNIYKNGYLLSYESMLQAWSFYLDHPDDGVDPYASPLLATDLSDFPPTLVITAEYDPLRDEGEVFAKRLQALQIPCRLLRYKGMVHDFSVFTRLLPQARACREEIINVLKTAYEAQNRSPDFASPK